MATITFFKAPGLDNIREVFLEKRNKALVASGFTPAPRPIIAPPDKDLNPPKTPLLAKKELTSGIFNPA